MSTYLSWEYFGGSKVQQSDDNDCSVAEKWPSRLYASSFEQLRRLFFFFFFFANLEDERDTFVQQMIGIRKFMCLYYDIFLAECSCCRLVQRLLFYAIHVGNPFFFCLVFILLEKCPQLGQSEE